MANLTTSSPVSDFRKDVTSEQPYKFTHMVPELATRHRHAHDPSRAISRWGSRVELPDEGTLFTAYSTVMVILFSLVDDMETAEDILEGLIDDVDDEEQIIHTQGELFALKTTYLSIIKMVDSIEANRLDLTSTGTPNPKEYFVAVLRAGGLATIREADELIPSKYQMNNLRASNPFYNNNTINSNMISFKPPKVPAI